MTTSPHSLVAFCASGPWFLRRGWRRSESEACRSWGIGGRREMSKRMSRLSIAACLLMTCLVSLAADPAAPATVHRAGSRREVHSSKPATKAGVPAKAKRSGTSSAHRRSARYRVRGRRRYYHRVRLPKSPSPERISQIQSALSRGGYYHGDVNGKWDGNTADAVRNFQSANNMDATGKLDAPTLQKLGLGSDIAGVSAPKPVTPGCCSAPASGGPAATGPSASGSASASATQHAVAPTTQTGGGADAKGSNAATKSSP